MALIPSRGKGWKVGGKTEQKGKVKKREETGREVETGQKGECIINIFPCFLRCGEIQKKGRKSQTKEIEAAEQIQAAVDERIIIWQQRRRRRRRGEAGGGAFKSFATEGKKKGIYVKLFCLGPYHSASTLTLSHSEGTLAESRNTETHSPCVPWCHISIVCPSTPPTLPY